MAEVDEDNTDQIAWWLDHLQLLRENVGKDAGSHGTMEQWDKESVRGKQRKQKWG